MKKDEEVLDSAQVVEDAKTTEGEKVMVDKLTLDNILQRINELEQGGSPINKIKRISNRTARVRFVDGKIVKGYGKTWEKTDIGGRKYMMLEVIDIDGKSHEVEYLKFMETGEYVDAEIVSSEKEETQETIGSTLMTKVDYDNYRSEAGAEVPMIVTTVKYTYKMKLPNGDTVTLSEEALN